VALAQHGCHTQAHDRNSGREQNQNQDVDVQVLKGEHVLEVYHKGSGDWSLAAFFIPFGGRAKVAMCP